ncbi:MAG: hypothetical protein RLZZ542_1372, partial [Pseudomonadota bacterium]
MTQSTNPWAKPIDPLAQDIAAVLKRMGGSAHQRDVVQCVAAMKRQRIDRFRPGIGALGHAECPLVLDTAA